MQNKYIIHIIVANILWSLIPVFVTGLFDEYSIFMIIFLRFFVSGVFLLIIGLIYIILNNRTISNPEFKIELKKLFKFTLRKNEKFFDMKYIYYFAFLGFFGIVLQIIGYFLALKTTSIAFTMIGFPLSIVLVAFYEHGVKAEKLDFFKVLYLLILIFSIAIIIFVKTGQKGSSSVGFSGFFYVLLFTGCVTFLHIGMTRESYSKGEIKFVNKNTNYKIVRMIIKLSLIFFMGIGLLFPFLIIVYLLPIEGALRTESIKFFEEFNIIFAITLRWEVLFLIFFSTVIPYLLIFIARVNWSPYNLTYSQWGSIVTIIEPIGGILFGVLIVNESFPIEFLIIIIFLLTISILLRYAHETNNKVNAIILLNKKQGLLPNLALELLKIEGICCVDSLLGTHDLMLNVKTNSIKDIYYIINTEIKKFEGIEDIEILFIEKINKLTQN